MLRLSAPLLALAVAGVLTACSSSEPQAAAKPEPSVSYTAGDAPVLRAGKPGEEPQVVAPGESGAMPNAEVYTDEDVEFVTEMVPHHAQALEMVELAPERAEDPRVRSLAERIAAGQRPEIAAMQAWLEQRGLPAPETGGGHGSHGDDMQGMATGEQMTRLLAADGGQFDRLFLSMMIRHHEGALAMADRLGGGTHPIVTDMAKDVAATQAVEIARMQEVLTDLEA